MGWIGRIPSIGAKPLTLDALGNLSCRPLGDPLVRPATRFPVRAQDEFRGVHWSVEDAGIEVDPGSRSLLVYAPATGTEVPVEVPAGPQSMDFDANRSFGESRLANEVRRTPPQEIRRYPTGNEGPPRVSGPGA